MPLRWPQATEWIISSRRGILLSWLQVVLCGEVGPTWFGPWINAYILANRALYWSPVGSRGPQPAPACRTVSASGLSQTSGWGHGAAGQGRAQRFAGVHAGQAHRA